MATLTVTQSDATISDILSVLMITVGAPLAIYQTAKLFYKQDPYEALLRLIIAAGSATGVILGADNIYVRLYDKHIITDDVRQLISII